MPFIYSPDTETGPLIQPPATLDWSGGSSGVGSSFGGGGGLFSSPSAFGSFTGGISSIFSGLGQFKEAGAYEKAADIANKNARVAAQTMRVQEAQSARKLYQVTGQQAAAYGSASLTGGTATDVLRDTVRQGALQHQVTGLQGSLQRNSFLEQAQAYDMQAKAARLAGIGGIVGGIFGIAGGFLGL